MYIYEVFNYMLLQILTKWHCHKNVIRRYLILLFLFRNRFLKFLVMGW